MAPEILVAMTPDARNHAPSPLIYYDVIHETGIDPWAPWYPCVCPGALEDEHGDDCWLGWIRLTWMDDVTTEIPVVMSDVDDEHGEEVTDADVQGRTDEDTVDHGDG